MYQMNLGKALFETRMISKLCITYAQKNATLFRTENENFLILGEQKTPTVHLVTIELKLVIPHRNPNRFHTLGQYLEDTIGVEIYNHVSSAC